MFAVHQSWYGLRWLCSRLWKTLQEASTEIDNENKAINRRERVSYISSSLPIATTVTLQK
jgi:hypothetical protein